MANGKNLMPFIIKWEGGFVNNPLDKGGPTMKGVTLKTYQKYYGSNKTVEDLKKISDDEWYTIFKVGYWDPCKADQIKSQSVANIIVDWAYNSGVKTAIKNVQKYLGVVADGIIGPKTLGALNNIHPRTAFDSIKKLREDFYKRIVKNNPSQSIFLKGWMNRINDLKFEE